MMSKDKMIQIDYELGGDVVPEIHVTPGIPYRIVVHRRRMTVMVSNETTSIPRNPVTRLFHSLVRDLRGAYRPELHYMRGPGPKWREKHAPPQPQPDILHLNSTKPAV